MKRYVCGLFIALVLLTGACGEKPREGLAAEATALPAATAVREEPPAPTIAPTPAPVVAVEVAAPEATPAPTGVPTHTPAPTFTPTPTPVPTPDCLHGAAHPDVFAAGEPVKTETGYVSDTVSIQIKRIENPEGFPKPMVCFVADIYIEDITSFRTALSAPTLRESELAPMDVLDLMARENALLMINGDFACKWTFGCLVNNGQVNRQEEDTHHRYDTCVLRRDGTMVTLDASETSVEKILAMDPWQAWCFGPALLDEEGKAKEKFNSSLTDANPRTAVGYYAPGHYCFVVVDGRERNGKTYSKGMTMKQLSQFMASLGCRAAYNLDGGGSSVMAFDAKRVNRPSGIRKIPDVIYICEPRKEN